MSLTQPEEERFRAYLAAYMAGESTVDAWCATSNAVAALRRIGTRGRSAAWMAPDVASVEE